MHRIIRRAITAIAGSAVIAGALAGPASAGLLVESATGCDNPALSQPFRPWLDPMSYGLARGGSFESGSAGWQLSGGARIVSGNEPWRVNRSSDSRSLLLPSGSSATTPTVCVGLGEPTLRFFTRRNSGLLSTLAVQVQTETSLGLVLSTPVGADLGLGGWHPTLPMPMLTNLLPLLPGQRTPVRFKITPLLGGSWQVDDVYVDPMRMR